MSDDDDTYGLVMPFVVCVSNGGIYDDRSFVAGARFEAVANSCIAGEHMIRDWQPPGLVPQLDLLAMQYGYSFLQEPWVEAPEEWTLVTMIKLAEEDL